MRQDSSKTGSCAHKGPHQPYLVIRACQKDEARLVTESRRRLHGDQALITCLTSVLAQSRCGGSGTSSEALELRAISRNVSSKSEQL